MQFILKKITICNKLKNYWITQEYICNYFPLTSVYFNSGTLIIFSSLSNINLIQNVALNLRIIHLKIQQEQKHFLRSDVLKGVSSEKVTLFSVTFSYFKVIIESVF